MVTLEKELLPGFEWELDFSCSRCGSTQALIFDKENEKMYCAACLHVIHGLQEAPSHAVEGGGGRGVCSAIKPVG